MPQELCHLREQEAAVETILMPEARIVEKLLPIPVMQEDVQNFFQDTFSQDSDIHDEAGASAVPGRVMRQSAAYPRAEVFVVVAVVKNL